MINKHPFLNANVYFVFACILSFSSAFIKSTYNPYKVLSEWGESNCLPSSHWKDKNMESSGSEVYDLRSRANQ